jgi:hypothetical protein
MMPLVDTKSVTSNDILPWHNYWTASTSFAPAFFPDPDALPLTWRERDAYLYATTRLEGFWGAANRIACNQAQSLEWHIEGGKVSKNKAVEILKNSNYVRLLRLSWADFARTNNGTILEVVRATGAPGSRVLRAQHLDSNRCQRTGDPENPIIYLDRQGREHLMRWHQVIMMVDEESAKVDANGMGECAAEHVYSQLYKFATYRRLELERAAGRKPTEIVSGVSSQTMASAFSSSDAPQGQPMGIVDQVAGMDIEGLGGGLMTMGANAQVAPLLRSYVHKGAMILPIMTNSAITSVTIPFARLPEGYDPSQELETSLLIYADALGIDPQSLAPLKGGQFGSGTQSKVLQEKSNIYGMASFKQQWTWAMQLLTGNQTVFYMTENDVARKHNEATISKMHTDDFAVQIEKGMITAEEARGLKVSLDELPDSFMPSTEDTQADQYSLSVNE